MRRDALSDPLAIAAALGLRVPERVFLREAGEVATVDLDALPGDRVVLKAVSPEVVHKTEAGAVAIVPKSRAEIARALRKMAARLAASRLRGFEIHRFVPHERALGRELLLGMRTTPDFGPVVTLAPGGVGVEHLARALRPGTEVAVFLPSRSARRDILAAVEPTVLGPLLLEGIRGAAPILGEEGLVALVAPWLEYAAAHLPHDLLEFEVNPVVVTEDGLFALDARLRAGTENAPSVPPPRPLEKIDRLLRPRSIAIAGISAKERNPGRVILENVLAEGFDPGRLVAIKPGAQEVAGIRAVPSVAALPEPVDLLVLSVDAETAVAAVEEAIEGEKAASVVLIPGGIGERAGTEGLAARLEGAIARSRTTASGGPVVNGGNCLGVRSLPGGYDTLFIPGERLGRAPRGEREGEAPLALLSQSGAFVCARSTTLSGIEPRFVLSIGNQIDLTAGDYLRRLRDDPGTEIVASYLEGFRPGDGLPFLEAAREIAASGRTVILHRAGRTEAGAGAAATHTASVAGDWTVTRALAEGAGIVLAETIEDFDDLTRLFTRLRGKSPGEMRLAALSNAGFESVAFADSLGPFRLATFEPGTRDRLRGILAASRLDGIVAPTNPVDTTPILGDEGFAGAARAILEDPGVDAAVVGCVPMTPALETIEAIPGSVPERLASLASETEKPWVAVVDGGPLYAPMRARLERAGIPTFRSADRALRLLGVWARSRNHMIG